MKPFRNFLVALVAIAFFLVGTTDKADASPSPSPSLPMLKDYPTARAYEVQEVSWFSVDIFYLYKDSQGSAWWSVLTLPDGTYLWLPDGGGNGPFGDEAKMQQAVQKMVQKALGGWNPPARWSTEQLALSVQCFGGGPNPSSFNHRTIFQSLVQFRLEQGLNGMWQVPATVASSVNLEEPDGRVFVDMSALENASGRAFVNGKTMFIASPCRDMAGNIIGLLVDKTILGKGYPMVLTLDFGNGPLKFNENLLSFTGLEPIWLTGMSHAPYRGVEYYGFDIWGQPNSQMLVESSVDGGKTWVPRQTISNSEYPTGTAPPYSTYFDSSWQAGVKPQPQGVTSLPATVIFRASYALPQGQKH